MTKFRLPPPSVSEGAEFLGSMAFIADVGGVESTDGKQKAIGIVQHIPGYAGEILLRLNSPRDVDTLIQLLLRHKRRIWPEAS